MYIEMFTAVPLNEYFMVPNVHFSAFIEHFSN